MGGHRTASGVGVEVEEPAQLRLIRDRVETAVACALVLGEEGDRHARPPLDAGHVTGARGRLYGMSAAVRGTQPGHRHRDEPVDRGPGRQGAGRFEGMEAVGRKFVRRDVVSDVSGLGTLGH